MPRGLCGTRLIYILRHTLNTRFLIFISVFSFTYLLWPQVIEDDTQYNETLVEEALRNVAVDSRFAVVYRKKSFLPKELKYILLWTRTDFAPFYDLGKTQRNFLTNNCSIINCYVTANRDFFGGDLTKFDAIAFNGRNMDGMTINDLPNIRSPHQKYIFFNLESADNYPVCNKIFDGFFNWTATYRLDSDIVHSYLLIKNLKEEIVGPKNHMTWVNLTVDKEEDMDRPQNKSKAVAWFVSNCSSRSKRKRFVQKLQEALSVYNLEIDIYGRCGLLDCPRYKESECYKMLERDYYFYLSLENSFDEDYVTEKLLTALQHDVIPIVYGGANYSKFLPPGSYLNGLTTPVEELATTIHKLIQFPEKYQEYFRWKNYYTYHLAFTKNVCHLCAVLNNKTKLEEYSVYENFRKWWNPAYRERC